jgi:DNA transformation protein
MSPKTPTTSVASLAPVASAAPLTSSSNVAPKGEAAGPASELPPLRERELAQLVNIGPFTARRLQSIGLRRPADLEALGAVAAYRSLAAAWPDDTTVFTLYALQGALMDLRWDALPDDVRADLWSSVA